MICVGGCVNVFQNRYHNIHNGAVRFEVNLAPARLDLTPAPTHVGYLKLDRDL